jgi:hypothetical protein
MDIFRSSQELDVVFLSYRILVFAGIGPYLVSLVLDVLLFQRYWIVSDIKLFNCQDNSKSIRRVDIFLRFLTLFG